MGTKEKLIERFKALPSDFTFDELEKLLKCFGYEKSNKGKTSGSRLHKPHPGNIIKTYAMKQVLNDLIEAGFIK